MLTENLIPQILFEDNHLIVLSKPAGLLSQGELKGDPNLVDWLRERLGRNYVGLVHRLDRNTSGVMVVAKRSKAATRLTEALQAGKICRTYLGWVAGNLAGEQRWAHRLFKDESKNLVRVVGPAHPGGKEAVLAARPVSHAAWKGRPVTLVEFELETGRSHQIRVQAAHEGFPLLGDRKYASAGGRAAAGNIASAGSSAGDFPRTALHSHRLAFPHPMSGEELRFEAPLPEDMDLTRGKFSKT